MVHKIINKKKITKTLGTIALAGVMALAVTPISVLGNTEIESNLSQRDLFFKYESFDENGYAEINALSGYVLTGSTRNLTVHGITITGMSHIGLFNPLTGGYQWVQTLMTPMANARNVDTSVTQAAIDNLLLAIETNDLVPVIGINGIEGYAYARQLRVIPEHPSLAPEGRNIRLINVYSSIGEVLDSFEVFYGSGWLEQE